MSRGTGITRTARLRARVKPGRNSPILTSICQVNDWMNELYPRWVAAHAVMIVTPVYWHSPPSTLKLMMDRLVCADGGNPDLSSTHGKTPEEAKALELRGWDYPRHLAGRLFALFVHGDAVGAESVRAALTDWLL